MKRRLPNVICLLIFTLIVCAYSSRAHAVVTFDWAHVGDAGNPNDPQSFRGAVSYEFNISKYEVTNAQYVQFLNAKAAADPLGLYNTAMATDARGGIVRSGSSGGYAYAAKSGRANQPVTILTFYNALRFANWMNNGQGNGDTETGAYTLLGGTATPSNGTTVTRNSNAVYFLPSRDEWSKAGYYQPASSGGDTDGYWNYPTRTNMLPVGEAPAGGVNSVNTQGPNGFALTKSFDFDNNQNYLTDVGAYVSASSYYGTFDQGGNVAEWTEQILSGLYRAYRGGSWLLEANSTGIIVDGVGAPGVALATVGFRMASIPEPSGIVSCVVVFGSVLGLRRSSRKASHFRAVLKFS